MPDARQTFDRDAPKKATNLSINSDLLKQARALSINCSAVLETALAGIVAEKRQQRWRRDNQQAVKEYNARVEAGHVFSDGLREF